MIDMKINNNLQAPCSKLFLSLKVQITLSLSIIIMSCCSGINFDDEEALSCGTTSRPITITATPIVKTSTSGGCGMPSYWQNKLYTGHVFFEFWYVNEHDAFGRLLSCLINELIDRYDIDLVGRVHISHVI
jgi:hypothetical protein